MSFWLSKLLEGGILNKEHLLFRMHSWHCPDLDGICLERKGYLIYFFPSSLKFYLDDFLTCRTDFENDCYCLSCWGANSASLFFSNDSVADRTRVQKHFCTWSTQVIPRPLHATVTKSAYRIRVTISLSQNSHTPPITFLQPLRILCCLRCLTLTRRHTPGMLTEPTADLNHAAQVVYSLLLQWTRTSGRWL